MSDAVRLHRIEEIAEKWRLLYHDWENDTVLLSPSADDLAVTAWKHLVDDETPSEDEGRALATIISVLQGYGHHTDYIAPLVYDCIKELTS